ncbi:MAG: hypothetical protein IJK28_11120 [Clostridia bacterium]|nr:hypothetical protein [Clostridia bacterium]
MKRRTFLHVLCGLAIALGTVGILLTASVDALLTDRSVVEEAALETVPERMAMFTGRVEDIAQRVGFEPKTALAFYSESRVRDLTAARVEWFYTLLAGENVKMPDFSADDLTYAILEDETFAAAGGTMREARDEGAYEVERAARKAFFPFRSSLVGKLSDSAAPRLRQVRKLIRYPMWGCLALLVLAADLLLFLDRRRLLRALVWILAGISAGGLGAASLAVPVLALRIPAAAGEVSHAFAMELSRIQTALLTRYLLISLGLALVACLLFLFLRRRTREGHRA